MLASVKTLGNGLIMEVYKNLPTEFVLRPWQGTEKNISDKKMGIMSMITIIWPEAI